MKTRTLTAVILVAALLCGRSMARDEEHEREGDRRRGDREEHVERHHEKERERERHHERERKHAEERERERHRDREHGERHEREMHEREMAERREHEMHEREMHERREMAERRRREMHHERRELPEPEILEFIEAHMPDMLPELRELREHNPDAYHRHLRDTSERIRHFKEVRQHAPDVAEALMRSHQIERECHKLAHRLRETRDSEERKPQIAKLREMLHHVFELRLKEPELRIRHMENEIREIKVMIERRKQNQERIVEKHLKEMVGPAEEGELEWW